MIKTRIAKREYVVYLAKSYDGMFYYGYTNDMHERMTEHKRKVMQILTKGENALLKNDNLRRGFHGRIATHQFKRGFIFLTNIDFTIVFKTDSKKDAMEVEMFLIKKAMQSNLKSKCCNVVC